jgi:hypothetical protein
LNSEVNYFVVSIYLRALAEHFNSVLKSSSFLCSHNNSHYSCSEFLNVPPSLSLFLSLSRTHARTRSRAHARAHTHTHTHIYIYIYIYDAGVKLAISRFHSMQCFRTDDDDDDDDNNNNNNNNNNTLFSVLHQQSEDQLQIQHK